MAIFPKPAESWFMLVGGGGTPPILVGGGPMPEDPIILGGPPGEAGVGRGQRGGWEG